jgi:hypothetical protein
MANYPLANTASQINLALQAVVGADAEPTNGSDDMVTSNGVFDYIETQLGPFKTKTVTTQAVGISNTDNETSIPTSAAVKDFVDTTVPTISRVLITPADITRTRVSGGDIQTNGLQDDGSYLSGASISNEVLGIFSYDIPTGYTATSLEIHGFRVTATVYSNSIATDSATEIGAETGINQDTQGSATIDITDTASSTATYITIKFKRSGGYTNKLTGAKLTLTKN